MPIYAYKCESCGFAKDVLQKMSDTPLEVCPSCSASAFKKQLTAAGFQLKGSGWYATDFKGSGSAPSTAVAPASGDSPAPVAEAAKPKADAAPASAPAASAS
jgi:putative FmdB family regulatory protein